MSNEEQNIADLPTEEEEKNLFNIIQAVENTRIQTTENARIRAVEKQKNYNPNEIKGIRKVWTIIIMIFMGLFLIFIGVIAINNYLSTSEIGALLFGILCIALGGVLIIWAYLGSTGKVKYFESDW